jgi:hypothetical protein
MDFMWPGAGRKNNCGISWQITTGSAVRKAWFFNSAFSFLNTSLGEKVIFGAAKKRIKSAGKDGTESWGTSRRSDLHQYGFHRIIACYGTKFQFKAV